MEYYDEIYVDVIKTILFFISTFTFNYDKHT